MNFYKDLGNAPEGCLFVDLIDKEGHFEPGNVIWKQTTRKRYDTAKLKENYEKIINGGEN